MRNYLQNVISLKCLSLVFTPQFLENRQSRGAGDEQQWPAEEEQLPKVGWDLTMWHDSTLEPTPLLGILLVKEKRETNEREGENTMHGHFIIPIKLL